MKGISLRQGDEVVDMVVVEEAGCLLTLCEKGYGKRTDITEYPRIHRGGRGVLDIRTTARNGGVIACKQVHDDDEVMVITQNGVMIRVPVRDISRIGRNTQGVKVINLDSGDRVIDMTKVIQNGDADASEDDDEAPEPGNGKPS